MSERKPDTVQGRFYEALAESPQARALAHVDVRGAVTWRTYQEVHDWASGYSAELGALGLGPGETCMLVLPSDEHCAGVLLGVLLRGAVPLLMAPPTIQAEGRYSSLLQVLHRVAKKAKPRLLIAPEAMASMGDELGARIGSTQLHFGQVEPGSSTGVGAPSVSVQPSAPIDGTAVAAMQLTSGTTGFPRICVWKQADVTAALDGMAAGLALRRDDICLNWTPLYHDMGLVANFLLCLTSGLPIVMVNPVDFVRRPALWLRALADTKATITWAPNFGYALATERARDEELVGVRLDLVRSFLNSSERVHARTVEAFYRRFASYGLARRSLKVAYGAAEVIGAATVTEDGVAGPMETVDQPLLLERGVAEKVSTSEDGHGTVAIASVGRPCPGVELRILSPRGRTLPDGQVGEITIHLPTPRSAYLKDARATRRLHRGGAVHTGDLGYLRNGELFWVGRVSERITTMGRKIDPSDFERLLFEVAELRPGCFAAFGVDDPQLGTQQVVVVSEVNDPIARSIGEVIGDVRNRIFLGLGLKLDDLVMVPKGTLTKTSSGKRRHRLFRDLYLRGELESFRLSVK